MRTERIKKRKRIKLVAKMGKFQKDFNSVVRWSMECEFNTRLYIKLLPKQGRVH